MWKPLRSAVATTTEADVICDVKNLKSAETSADTLSHWIFQALDQVVLTAVKGYGFTLLLLTFEAWLA